MEHLWGVRGRSPQENFTHFEANFHIDLKHLWKAPGGEAPRENFTHFEANFHRFGTFMGGSGGEAAEKILRILKLIFIDLEHLWGESEGEDT